MDGEKTLLAVRISRELAKKLKVKCAEDGKTMQSFVEEAILRQMKGEKSCQLK